MFGRNGYKTGRIQGAARCANPVLIGSVIAGEFVSPPDTLHQQLVCATQNLLRKRPMHHLCNTGLHRGTVIQYLFGIVSLGLGKGFGDTARLDFQHLTDRHMSALDLGRQHRFLSCQWREQDVCVGNGRQQTIVTS